MLEKPIDAEPLTFSQLLFRIILASVISWFFINLLLYFGVLIIWAYSEILSPYSIFYALVNLVLAASVYLCMVGLKPRAKALIILFGLTTSTVLGVKLNIIVNLSVFPDFSVMTLVLLNAFWLTIFGLVFTKLQSLQTSLMVAFALISLVILFAAYYVLPDPPTYI